jgi:hypothetical protein
MSIFLFLVSNLTSLFYIILASPQLGRPAERVDTARLEPAYLGSSLSQFWRGTRSGMMTPLPSLASLPLDHMP